MNVPCPVHGDRRAHRGCRFCRQPICRLCEVKMRGHLYCSTRCARDDGRHAVWRRVRKRLDRPVPAGAAIFAIAVAAATPTLFALRAVSTLERLDPAARTPASLRAPLSSARIDSVMETPAGKVIEGSGPQSSAVFLFSAGQFLAAAPVEFGRFRFEGVRVNGPYRVGVMPLSSGAVAEEPAPLPREEAVSGEGDLPRDPGEVLGTGVPRLFAPNLTRGPRDRREVLVSFDAGSSNRGAAQILDTLASRGVRTTVFLTGVFIRRYPGLVKRIAREGHEVGNHTNTHPHLTTYAQDRRQATRPGVDKEFLAAELAETAWLYQETTGLVLAPIWRAPYGEQNGQIRRWAAEAGYWHVGWTGGRAGLDGLDWVRDPASTFYRSAGDVVARLIARAENGGIILLHLGSDREEPISPLLPLLLDGLSARSFRFALASEFLTESGYTPERLASSWAAPPSPSR